MLGVEFWALVVYFVMVSNDSQARQAVRGNCVSPKIPLGLHLHPSGAVSPEWPSQSSDGFVTESHDMMGEEKDFYFIFYYFFYLFHVIVCHTVWDSEAVH